MASFNLFKRLLGDSDRREQARVQARSGTRMLVVDDSPTIRAVLTKMLIQDGYTVLKAADGESALEIARQEQPDLIFLDIVLPGMNGFAVLRALRRDEQTRDIPIVMISGNLQATEQFYVQRFGADDFMKKPFGRAEVFSRIQELVKSGRLSKREDASLDVPVVAELEDMAHIPDVALPDEDLKEHDSAGAAGLLPDLDDADVSDAEGHAVIGRETSPVQAERVDQSQVGENEGPEQGDDREAVAVHEVSDDQPRADDAPPSESNGAVHADPPGPRPEKL